LDLSLSLFEQLCHPVKPLLHGLAVIADPLRQVFEVVVAELTFAHPAVLTRSHETGILEQADVLLDTRQGHTERLGELTDRSSAAAQALDDLSPRRVGQRRQSSVDRLILNHVVQYYVNRGPCQVLRIGRAFSNLGDTAEVTTAPRYLVLIGSGEMAPQMARVHRGVIKELAAAWPRSALTAAVVDTPYGFQENADALSDEQLDFFGRRLGLDVSLASLRRADMEPIALEEAYATIRAARFVFSGPGSPSYAVAQWSATEIPTLLAEKLIEGGAVVVASAAAATLGRFVVPVYEIYKGGADPHWLPGLDVLASVGIAAAVVPHWDNSEGGGHDTRYCFLGARRLAALERDLPEDVSIIGLDEHTALKVDINADAASVHGRGNITLRRRGAERVFPTGSIVPLDELRGSADATKGPEPHSAKESPQADLAREIVELRGTTDVLERRSALVDPLIEELLRMRAEARAMGVYDVADRIRDRLVSLGVEVTDGAGGTTEFRLPD
jgi:hypothetical protein